jgi:hypothetical protein
MSAAPPRFTRAVQDGPPEQGKPPVNQLHALFHVWPACSRLAAAVRSPAATALAALRFLLIDRLGVIPLGWLLVAFVARPLLMSAHHGAGAFGNDWLRSVMTPAQLAASAQWASLARLILILALAHVRLAGVPVGGVDVLQTSRGRLAIGAAYAPALTVGYMAFIWKPVTAVSLMLHDAFIFFDAINRIDQGQTPSNDFQPRSAQRCSISHGWGRSSPAAMPARSNCRPRWLRLFSALRACRQVRSAITLQSQPHAWRPSSLLSCRR